IRPTGEDDPNGLKLANLLDPRRARQDRAEHLLLADSPGDQLRVLPAEIQYNDATALAHSFLNTCTTSSPRQPVCMDYSTTKLTSLSGTTITFTTRWPSKCCAIFGSLRTRLCRASLSNPASTNILPFTRPFTCTTISTCSSAASSGTNFGHAACASVSRVWPRISQSSSARCGTIGLSIMISSSNTSFAISGRTPSSSGSCD